MDAIDRAREAAGDKAVSIGGGGDVIRQGLAAGIVDELHIIVAPVILGGGKRLFDDFTTSLDLQNRARAAVPVGDLHGVRGQALGPGETPMRQTGRVTRCRRRCAAPDGDTDTSAGPPGEWRRSMNPRSVASSQTGRRGHDVRHASMVSAYGRWPGPIHSSRSRIRLSTVSDTGRSSRAGAAWTTDDRPYQASAGAGSSASWPASQVYSRSTDASSPKWPAASSTQAIAPGTCRASQSPCAAGTRTSLRP